MKRSALSLILTAVMLIIDQIVKSWVATTMVEGQSLGGPWPGVFEIRLTFNQGVAFGMLHGFGVMLAPIAFGIAGWALYHSVKHPAESRWTHIALGLLAAGALGNLYDRLFHGRVTDMFYIRAIDFPVFNVADVCISAAAVMLILKWGKESLPAQKADSSETSTSSSQF